MAAPTQVSLKNATNSFVGNRRAEQIGEIFGLPDPNHGLKPSAHADYEGFHARSGNLLPDFGVTRTRSENECAQD
jgi:hypothetical protein